MDLFEIGLFQVCSCCLCCYTAHYQRRTETSCISVIYLEIMRTGYFTACIQSADHFVIFIEHMTMIIDCDSAVL